jgi:hypothetical protein
VHCQGNYFKNRKSHYSNPENIESFIDLKSTYLFFPLTSPFENKIEKTLDDDVGE